MRIVGRIPASSTSMPRGSGDGPQPVEQRVELGLDPGEAVAAEVLGVEVDLQVEGAELGHEVRVVDGVEELEGDRGRTPVAIDQEHLLLGADAAHAGLDPPFGEHAAERVEVTQQRVHELAAVLRHGSPSAGPW